MQQASSTRVLLFLAVSSTIVAAAFLFSSPSGEPLLPPSAAGRRPADGVGLVDSGRREPAARAQRLRGKVRRSARLFLPAFFRYEVGELTPRIERTLRASTTPQFAARLLATSPRPPASGRFPLPARLRRIEIAFVSVLPPLAVVSGAAHRGHGFEQFSFLFKFHGSAWLASGPGE